MKKLYLIVPSDTMTFAKYLSLKTGVFYDTYYAAPEERSTDHVFVPQIENHIIIANKGEAETNVSLVGNNKNINHEKNGEYYTKLLKENEFHYITDFSDESNKEIYEDTDNLVIIIPGIKRVMNVNNRTQYKIAEAFGQNIVIQKATFTDFVKNLLKMPGTAPHILNYVSSTKFKVTNDSPEFKVQYLQNVYSENANVDINALDINGFYDMLDINFVNRFKVDLFVSHQSLDKEPYVDNFIETYRKENPEDVVWFDRDFFKPGIESNSPYARNTIAHGILNSEKIKLIMSNNYFNKLLKNIDDGENADYFGINYELALISNIKNSSIDKLSEINILKYKYIDNEVDETSKIFDFAKYTEVNSSLTLHDINYETIENQFSDDVDVTKHRIKYIYRDLI